MSRTIKTCASCHSRCPRPLNSAQGGESAKICFGQYSLTSLWSRVWVLGFSVEGLIPKSGAPRSCTEYYFGLIWFGADVRTVAVKGALVELLGIGLVHRQGRKFGLGVWVRGLQLLVLCHSVYVRSFANS